MEGIFLLLGTNLGNRQDNLQKARQLISQQAGEVIHSSSIYETEAWGETDQPLFLNQVIQINTNLPPEMLLERLQGIEEAMGRVRHRKWGERVIDIDILYYRDKIIDTDTLKVPHPGIPTRRFTLAPLCEIAAKAMHPTIHKTQQELLNACTDPLKVWKWNNGSRQ